jgi:cell division protein FtsX
MNILRYAFKNIFRNLFLSGSSVLIIALLVFFVNILFFVLFASDRFIESINNRISLTINFRDGYDEATPRAQILSRGMSASFTGIVVEYLSRENAFAILKSRNPDLAALVESGDQNPLPNSIRISNIDLDEYSRLDEYISRFQDILQYDAGDMNKKLLDYKTQYERISFVVKLLRSLQTGVYILLGLFGFTVFAIIYMIIRNFVFFQKDEIRIIELVGGKPIFIYGPFALQALFYALIAVFFVFLFIVFLHSAISVDFISGPLTHVVEDFYTYLGYIFPYQFVTFAIL